MYGQIGVVMLIGLAAKNAILIVEFAKTRFEDGQPLIEAALEGARVRLRPILMTSFAFILGCVPLWTAAGSGAASRRILGTVVITGMLAATLIAVFLIPLLLRPLRAAGAETGRPEPHHDRAGAGGKRVMTSRTSNERARSRVDGARRRDRGRRAPSGRTTSGLSRSRLMNSVAAAPGTAADARSLGDEPWIAVFEDDVLRQLVTTALAQNYDLRIAASRIEQAAAQYGITRADRFPTVTGQASAQGQQGTIVDGEALPLAGLVQLGGALSWELDFWGKFRRATEAARAEIAASEWGRRAIVTSLVSQVGSLYFELRALDFELEISERTLASREESLRLTVIRERGGVTPLVDVRQAEQLVFSRTRPDRRCSTPDRAGRKRVERAARTESRADRARPHAHGPDGSPDGAGRASVVAPRAAAGHPAGRAADGRGQRAHRRGQGRLLSPDLTDRVGRRREHVAGEPLHRRRRGRSAPAWCNRSSTPGETARRSRSPKRGARRASSSIARRFSRRSARYRTPSSATAGCAS